MSIPPAIMTGGDGAADYMIKVAGNMGEQGNSGVLPYKMAGGALAGGALAGGANADGSEPKEMVEGGDPTLGQMAVPATLVLASQYVNKLFPKKGGAKRGQNGGLGMTEIAVPAVLVLASNMFGKGRKTRRLSGGGSEAPPANAVEGDDGSSTGQLTEGGANSMIVPAGLLLGNTLMPKMLGRRVSMKPARRFRHRKSVRGLRNKK
jgi:hypothetical protein